MKKESITLYHVLIFLKTTWSRTQHQRPQVSLEKLIWDESFTNTRDAMFLRRPYTSIMLVGALLKDQGGWLTLALALVMLEFVGWLLALSLIWRSPHIWMGGGNAVINREILGVHVVLQNTKAKRGRSELWISFDGRCWSPRESSQVLSATHEWMNE